jgi:putative aldouronate transport system permease protein
MQKNISLNKKKDDSFKHRIVKDLCANKYKYLMFTPVIIYLLLFSYKPMYGVLIAFQNFRPATGISGSAWVGVKHFKDFFTDFYFTRIIKNTVLISVYSILWGFPIPIIFALLLNELKSLKFKKIVQTTSYLPHFISVVIVCSIITQFSYTNGLFNDIIVFLGGKRSSLLQDPGNFRTIYVTSGVWQGFGWNSIIYIAAIAGIDQELYESAHIDGAGRFSQIWYITLPGIVSTIIILFILRTGSILSVGSEKTLLLYNPLTYSTSDIISTYTYRRGIIEGAFSYSTAVGLFNSVINLFFLLSTNYISRKVSDIGLF